MRRRAHFLGGGSDGLELAEAGDPSVESTRETGVEFTSARERINARGAERLQAAGAALKRFGARSLGFLKKMCAGAKGMTAEALRSVAALDLVAVEGYQAGKKIGQESWAETVEEVQAVGHDVKRDAQRTWEDTKAVGRGVGRVATATGRGLERAGEAGAMISSTSWYPSGNAQS